MQQVLIDACGWVACMDASLNVELELETLLGPCEWIVLSCVAEELHRLQTERGRAKPLLLDMLGQKSTHVSAAATHHTDDAIVAYARRTGCTTLTVDTALKRRLYDANLQIVEVRQNKRLHLVEAL